MYESPINFVTKQIQAEIEEAIEKHTIKAVQECGVVVDKEELIKALNYDRQQYEKGYADAKRVIREALNDVPERKTGHWIKVNDTVISGYCSACGWQAILYKDNVVGMPYCPMCGARMDGEHDS